jgi:CheY-like chemotaxis protein
MGRQQQGRPVVLIVEDEPLTLIDAVELATEAGFEALSAKNADDAIAILEQRPHVRVIFTDVNMPGSIDGLKLAHVVRNRWPPIEIIVTSALSVEDSKLPERGIFLAKPYTPTQVASALHNLAA